MRSFERDLCAVDDFPIPICTCVYKSRAGFDTERRRAYIAFVCKSVYLQPRTVYCQSVFPDFCGAFRGRYERLYGIPRAVSDILGIWYFARTLDVPRDRGKNCCAEGLRRKGSVYRRYFRNYVQQVLLADDTVQHSWLFEIRHRQYTCMVLCLRYEKRRGSGRDECGHRHRFRTRYAAGAIACQKDWQTCLFAVV